MARLRIRGDATWAPRDARLWPFRADSPWNYPIGSGATFENATDAQTANFIATSITGTNIVAWVNSETFSHPVYLAKSTDTLATVTPPTGSPVQYRIPSGATPATGSDANLHVIDPTGRYVDETWVMSGSNPTWTCSRHERIDLYAKGIEAPPAGIRAAGVSVMGGLIRSWELNTGVIRHALAMLLDNKQLKVGPVWPATRQDGDAASVYSGLNPMGTFAAIPPSVNITALGLNADSLMIAKALQDYGAYVVDRGGATWGFYAETGASTSKLNNIRSQLNTIRGQMRVVTNNNANNIGGGGTLRRSFAPDLGTPPLS